MAQPPRDPVIDLERHRHLLEENVEKLRKSLQHWQMWEAEYEGLKEEILSEHPTPNSEKLASIGQQYEGFLVTSKEVEEILGQKMTRTAAQVVNILDRRIDYVEQNVRTVQKQLEAAEHRVEASKTISADFGDDDGLPLTEIVEELDEDGNVISGRISTPSTVRPQLLDALKKAGVDDLPAVLPKCEPVLETVPDSSSDPQERAAGSTAAPRSTKKGVKFADDTKSGSEGQKSAAAQRIEKIMNAAKKLDLPPTQPPVIPDNENPEDASLRRQMLQYSMSEVGSVVAELELEEGSDWSEGDYDDTEVEDEDEFGRSTTSVIDDELRQKMIELEKKLGARVMENIGQKASDFEIVKEGIGMVKISAEGEPPKSSLTPKDTISSHSPTLQPSDKTSKKSVKFSEELDIAPSKSTPDSILTHASSATHKVPPVGDIVERIAPAAAAAAPTIPKTSSRFKSARTPTPKIINGPLTTPIVNLGHNLQPAKRAAPSLFSTPIAFSPAADMTRTVPTGPEGKVLAPEVVERETPLSSEVQEPDEFDPQFLNQQVATEYHKKRNQMIYDQGGFLKEDESPMQPLSEEEGGPKKLSRFKAARLGNF